MGLINCFGDHIPHLADERRLLRQMEKEWSLNIWTIQQTKCSFFVDVETTLHKTSFVTQLKDEDDNTFTHIPRRDFFAMFWFISEIKGKDLTEARKCIYTEMKSTMTETKKTKKLCSCTSLVIKRILG